MSVETQTSLPAPAPSQARPTRSLRELLSVRRYGLQMGTVAMALAIWTLFAIGAPQTWVHSWDIYSALMSTVPLTGIIALALTLVVIAGEIDLSFAAVIAVGAWVFVAAGQGVPGLIAGLAAGVGVGLLNGALIVAFGVPSLVLTIGTFFFWDGIVIYGTDGKGSGTEGGFVPQLLTQRILWGKVPAEFVWMIGVAVVLWVVLNRRRLGAHIYLTGDNDQSARMMGVRTGAVKVAIFGLVGLCAAFAGIASTLESNYFWPTVGGQGAILPVVAAVFLGGTSIFGGRGTIFGTFVAAFVLGAIEPGIVSIGWTGLLTQVIYGAVLVGALVMQSLVLRRVKR
jgi:simple sugar transport system permease protein